MIGRATHLDCCHVMLQNVWMMVVGTRRMRQRYVRRESRGHPDEFGYLSELVMGGEESDGYQSVDSEQAGHLWGKKGYQGDSSL